MAVSGASEVVHHCQNFVGLLDLKLHYMMAMPTSLLLPAARQNVSGRGPPAGSDSPHHHGR